MNFDMKTFRKVVMGILSNKPAIIKKVEPVMKPATEEKSLIIPLEENEVSKEIESLKAALIEAGCEMPEALMVSEETEIISEVVSEETPMVSEGTPMVSEGTIEEPKTKKGRKKKSEN